MKKIDERKRRGITGRRSEHSFVQLPHYVLESPQFIHLDPHAKALFMYWAGKFKGKNNGDFSAPNNRFKEAGFRSALTLHKAKLELVDTGWAIVTRHGHRRACTLYALTIWPIDDCEGKLELAGERVAQHLWKTKMVDHLVNHCGPRSEPKPLKKAA